jgi:hypothetical protein
MPKRCRERALALLELGEKADIPEEHKTKAVAVAQMWLSIAVIEDQLAIWANQIEQSTLGPMSDGPD